MLADRYTRSALERLHRLGAQASSRAWAEVGDAAAERRAAGRARQRVLDDLPAWLDRLQQQATANGVRVHRAADFQTANRIIVGALQAASQTAALCNHSPLHDEIALSRALTANDLSLTRLHPGDHLLELVGGQAGHPVWPAAHLRVEDIGAAMQARWRIPATLDPDNLAATTFNRTRPALMQVKAAILGLNFAVAATGALVCLDNDGHNASLVALADHVICVMGIEQVAAEAADLDVLVQVFARSGWGQPLPGYITPIVRPDPAAGPMTIDLILLDNGRSRVLAAGMAEALRCIGCGACHTICPVYAQIGGQGYGGFAHTGPIGAILNPLLGRPGLAADQPFLSTGCGACRPVCPVDIDLPGLLHRQRWRLAPTRASRRERAAFWLWRRLLGHPALFTAFMRLSRRLLLKPKSL
jgi:L-lactate dehydrogenase complex protein LldF